MKPILLLPRTVRLALWSLALWLALVYALTAQQVTLPAPRNIHTVCLTNRLVLGTNAVLTTGWQSGWGTNLATCTFPRTVLNVLAMNYHSADLYLMMMDWHSLTNAGTNGALPNMPAIKVNAGSYGGWDWGPQGRLFTNGLIVAVSSTPHTLTNIGAQALTTTNFQFDINYYERP